MKFILPLLLLALLSSCSTTGDHSHSAIKIEGRVIDNRKHPVKGVHVQAEGFKTVLTNEKGEFALVGLAPQADSLTVNFVAPGFKLAAFPEHRLIHRRKAAARPQRSPQPG